MSLFIIHPRLATDSIFVRDLPLCQLRLNNQKTIPWLILVPRQGDLKEIHDLDAKDRRQLIEEIAQASRALEELYAPDKINIATLGNIVPQLHVHVIARFKTDAAWPNPVWGRIIPELYPEEAIAQIKLKLRDFFSRQT